MAKKKAKPIIQDVPCVKIGDLILYRVADLASALDCHERTLKRYILSDKLQGVKIAERWYVTEEAFRDFISHQNPKVGDAD